jgi:hypothetical protein
VTSAKEKENPSADDHLPRGDDWCPIHGRGDHFKCWDTVLAETTSDVSPFIALHDAAHRVTGEAA